jgi:hypothetical protein
LVPPAHKGQGRSKPKTQASKQSKSKSDTTQHKSKSKNKTKQTHNLDGKIVWMLTSQAVWVASDLPFRGFAKSDIAYIIYNTSKPAVRGNNNKNNTTATEKEGQQVLSVMSSTTTTTTTTTTAKTLMTMTASDKIHVQIPMSKQQADTKSAHNNQRQRRILFHSHFSRYLRLWSRRLNHILSAHI